jgi:hypothetical protein
MSDGMAPPEGPADPFSQPPGLPPPPFPAQAQPAGFSPDATRQPLPPVYGQPGYGQPVYGQPGYALPPGPAFGAGPGQLPRTHLVWSRLAIAGGVLFNLILGLPAGLAALRYARQVRPQWEAGDLQGAARSSRKARNWAIASTVLDGLGVLLVALIVIGQSAASSNYDNPAVVAASLKTQLQQRISDPGSQFYVKGLKVTSVVCTKAGTDTDHCLDHFSDGQTATETAVISDNGNRYETH